MEKCITHHRPASFFDVSVADTTFTPCPVKVVTTARTQRKHPATIPVDKSDYLLGTTLSALHQLTFEQLLSSNQSNDDRREQLQGKKVLFVCCGHDGLDSKRFAFKLVKETGVRIFLVEDFRNTLALAMEESKNIEKLIRVDMAPRPSLLEDVMGPVQRVSAQVGGFDGVCTLWDDAVCLCARVADRLGLPCNPIRSVDIAHDKHLTREAMKSAGIPTPANYLIKCERDLEIAATVVGVPAILKPMYGASSLGVTKIDSLDELKEAYHRVLHMLEHCYEQGELMGLTFDESELGPTFKESSLSWIVIEEFLDGDEVDVDLVLKDGEAVYQCVVDDWPQIQPWFAEMGNTCPSGLPPSTQQELVSMAFDTATKAMGFRDGVFHCELKNTSKGPRVIEVNARMGGGPVWSMHKLAFGLDLIEETLYAALRIQGVPVVPKLPKRYVACSEKFFEHSMVVPKEFTRVVEVMGLFPNVVEATPLVESKETITGIREGYPTRAARFIAYGESAADVKLYAQKLLDMCDIPQVLREQRTPTKQSLSP